MKSKNKSSVSNSGGISTDVKPLDVADAPDRILEAIHHARALQTDQTSNAASRNAGFMIENLLRPVLATMAAAAEQLAGVV